MMIPSYEESVFVITDRPQILTFFQEYLPNFVSFYPLRGASFNEGHHPAINEESFLSALSRTQKNALLFFIDLESEEFYGLADKSSTFVYLKNLRSLSFQSHQLVFMGEHILQEKEFMVELVQQIPESILWFSFPKKEQLVLVIDDWKKRKQRTYQAHQSLSPRM
jgi:hypothetical protein